MRLRRWLTDGRPMIREGFAFRDLVSGAPVYYWLDFYGRRWMATSRWARFRVPATNWRPVIPSGLKHAPPRVGR